MMIHWWPQARPQAQHSELDQPDGDVPWDRWLEGLDRLETSLLLSAPELVEHR